MSKFFNSPEVYGISSTPHRLCVVGTALLPLVQWTDCIGEREKKGGKVIELEHEFDTQIAGCTHDMGQIFTSSLANHHLFLQSNSLGTSV